MDENPTTETLGSTACLAFCASHVPGRVVSIALDGRNPEVPPEALFRRQDVLAGIVPSDFHRHRSCAGERTRVVDYGSDLRALVAIRGHVFCFSLAVILYMTRVKNYVLDLIDDWCNT